MMQKFIKQGSQQAQRLNALAPLRMFSYNYSAATNPKVYLEVSRDGQKQGKLVFELFENHSPALALNFAALCQGQEQGRSLVGTHLANGLPGYGVHGGVIEGDEENLGATNARLADENLEMRHFKRGILSLLNDGPHANGSQFLVTFNEASYLNGYNNVIGQLVEGDSVLAQIEQDCDRHTGVKSTWKVEAAGAQH
uniref:Peptidyl-prolyl cis-trans isomerase n=1 Tax=Strombidium rassoulzadegani TaxID=1082188 RepID=A0A7S3CUW5_9SPIT|mmetsp:Transcript_8382/g.14002  ORF Transcript_8382/g.14002 Transcript_8382/m.14002 type:complete len:196 (+) Transcript_8382:43-630(+)